TLTATVADAPTNNVLTLTDTLGAGLDFTAVTDAGVFACTPGNPLVCTLPAGTPVGVYSLSYTATVNAAATGSVANAVIGTGDDDPSCSGTCDTDTPVIAPDVSYAKTADTAGPVRVGDTVAFTLTTTIANSLITSDVVLLTDTLGTGLDFAAVTSPGLYSVDASGDPVVRFTLPAGTGPGVYAVRYTATVNEQASGSVANLVVGSGGDNPVCTVNCGVEIPVADPVVTYAKTADAAQVQVGDVIGYTLTATVADAPTNNVLTLTDTLGAGLDFTAVTDAGVFVCTPGNPLVCTLPAGTPVGVYSLSYTATVNAQASGSVSNAVVGAGGDNPGCVGTCATDTPVRNPAVSYRKEVATTDPTVKVGDILTYTLTVAVANSATTEPIVLTDTLGAGLDFIAVADAGAFTCNATNPLVCTLPAGSASGTYSLAYTAAVNAQAAGSVDNVVVASGPNDLGCDVSCSTTTPVAQPVVSIAKVSSPASGETIAVGQIIEYGLNATVEVSATTEPIVLIDTPDAGLTIVDLPAGCEITGSGLTCTLPAGTSVGVHSLTYKAQVNEKAGEIVRNLVTGSGGGGQSPICTACATEHAVELPQIRLVKTAGVRDVRIGDLVRYTLSVENVGSQPLVSGAITDSPPAGFSYVEGSLQVVDADNAVAVSGQSPLRFEGLDIQPGETATLAYLMRVGAGVRPGAHINQAQVSTSLNRPISNVATAQVRLVGDPLTDETLVFGTVFDDRDGDGWQDSAAVSGLRVQGGFAAEAYVRESTMIDHGHGPQPETDAGSSLLRGLSLGKIDARQSEADPIENHRIIIRQHLSQLVFTDDFILSSDQGVTVRMDAEGRTTVEKTGDAAKGLNAAEITVERRIAQGEGGYVIDYVVTSTGIDERGIPGVRIASVEGLIMETDQYGRYHLPGVPGGLWERGRNFILKVDPSTLPEGAEFTTDNPLLRRVTPGVPVRFDWGVKLPVAPIQGRAEVIELALGRVVFAPGSTEVRERYIPAIEQMAAQVNAYQGGEVVIDAGGDTETLAFGRAEAVKAALLARVDPASARNLVVTARGRIDDPSSLIVGIDEGGALLGTLLFDTDASELKPEFAPLLDRIAAWLSQRGGGVVAVVGHTDVRASYEYNAALGMRRARAVYEALASRLPPDVRGRIRVESSEDPDAPVIRSRRQGGTGS
ncbi:OmpA family protein, partial [Brevundimonas diminuta]|uniref:OmpA family protein n=1 Tax=Brevundimonas diminuta TaxID=293 RepID=UPI0032079C87